MSRENVVRRPLSARNASKRSVDERLALRFPRLLRAVGRYILRRPPHSRLRQAVIWRVASQGLGAANRRDFDAVLPHYRPDAEIWIAPEMLGLGDIDAVYRGHEGYLKVYRDWLPAWGEGFQYEPYELIDVGDRRFLALTHIRIRGEMSGAELERPFAMLWLLDDEARVLHEQHYFDVSEALDAVGLTEEAS